MSSHDTFELRRQSDGQVYRFERQPEGGYKRRDKDLWIVRRPDWGWISADPETGAITGRPWNVLPADQGDHPPEGDWVSRKGEKSYVYALVYIAN